MTFFIFMAIIGIENFIFCAIIMAGVDTQKIDFLKAQKVNLEKNLKDTRDKLFSTQDILNAAQSKLDSDKKENQEKIKELVDSLLGEMENLKSTIADYEAQIAKTNQEIDDLKDSIKKLNEQAQSVEGVTIPSTRISSAIGERSSDQIQVESQKETEQKQEITQEVKTTSVPTQPETALTQPEVTPVQSELTEQQKYDTLVNLLQEVNNSLKMNASGSYVISSSQLAMLEQINQLRSSTQG